MKVVILAGGFGTRIRDVADNIPKPMIPIGGTPILWHIMKHYADYGLKKFIICVGYKSGDIKSFFLNREATTSDFTIALGKRPSVQYHNHDAATDWQVTLAETGLHSLTGSRILKIEKYLSDDSDFMLTYGDAVGDVNLDQLKAFHQSHNKIVTVTGVRPPSRFGELNIKENQVTQFNEKPQVSQGYISGGFFVFKKKTFDYLRDYENVMLEQEPLRKLAEEGEVMVYKHHGFWHPMDTHRDHRILNEMMEKGNAPWIKGSSSETP